MFLEFCNYYIVYWWWHGVVVNALVLINEVTLRRAKASEPQGQRGSLEHHATTNKRYNNCKIQETFV